MNHVPPRNYHRVHALRLDPPAMLQGGIAAALAMFITWLSQGL